MRFQIYQFPECDSDEDEEFKQQDRELKACVPFAVVGSNTMLEVAGKRVRGRQYPWGVVDGILIFFHIKYHLQNILYINFYHSRKSEAQRFREAAHNVDIDPYAGFEGCYPRCALRELPRSMHFANIPTRFERKRV